MPCLPADQQLGYNLGKGNLLQISELLDGKVEEEADECWRRETGQGIDSEIPKHKVLFLVASEWLPSQMWSLIRALRAEIQGSYKHLDSSLGCNVSQTSSSTQSSCWLGVLLAQH